jgi:ureidoglycolate lyase
MRITAHTAPPHALSRFAVLVEPPAHPGDRRLYSDWLAPVPGRVLQFHMNHVAPTALPLEVAQVEAHPTQPRCSCRWTSTTMSSP